MSFNVEFDQKAELEYSDAFNFYEERTDGLGYRFKFSVLKQVSYIAKNPLHYPSKKYDFRECKIDDFPYLIVYKVYPKENFIIIFSIFHTNRRPSKKYWK